jgi:hypothetical protein
MGGSGHTSFYNTGDGTANAEASYVVNWTLPEPGTIYDS